MNSEANSEPALYEMTVDLNVVEHLGANLYSNIAAVLTEIVANAWDADASRVSIEITEDHSRIKIEDDGLGMSREELNNKYLRVGYRRRDEDREHGRVTAKNRPVMGRKGLGKLSLFSIAETIEVQSAKEGSHANGFILSVSKIKEATEGKVIYRPEALNDRCLSIKKGTRIVLSNIKRKRLTQGVSALRKHLARRFSIIAPKNGFSVEINGKAITVQDRGDLNKVQFLWNLGDGDLIKMGEHKNIIKIGKLSGRGEDWPDSWEARGWLGTVRKPKDLDDKEINNLNGIVVFSRGRLIQENILDRLNDGRFYTKYLTGQIEAGFLDLDGEPDIATSDRQRVQEDDERYFYLIEFLRRRLNELERQWSEWRAKDEVKNLKNTSPGMLEWLESLPKGFRDSAEKMVFHLSALPLEDEASRKTLYRHAIFAFERMKLKGSVEPFVANIHTIETLLKVLADRDVLEAAHYRDIIKSRLDAIRDFEAIVGEDAKEKAIQKYLFNHLWLLDPSWERVEGTQLMETTLIKSGVVIEDMTKKEELGRVDIAYRTIAGKHVLIELKRAGRNMNINELRDQGAGYVDKLKKILNREGESDPNIEIIFVLGGPPAGSGTQPGQIKALMDSVSPGSRIVYYDELIKNALQSYSAYIEKTRAIDRIEQIIEKI